MVRDTEMPPRSLLLCWTELLSLSSNKAFLHPGPAGSSPFCRALLLSSWKPPRHRALGTPKQQLCAFDSRFLFWAEESTSLITRLPRPRTWSNINVSVTLITLLTFKPTDISHHLQRGLRWVVPGCSGCKTQRRFCHRRLTQNHSRSTSEVSTRAHMSPFPN